MTYFDRRRLLKALGLGSGSLFLNPLPSLSSAAKAPTRVIFFIQPHGHVPKAWKMFGQAPPQVDIKPLGALTKDEFAVAYRPLYRFRDKLLMVDGLSHALALFDLAETARTGVGDPNNHNVAVADLLTGAPATQRKGSACSGGAASIDQELGVRSHRPGRFASRVYGAEYLPNLAPAPFSFVGPAQAAPLVARLEDALTDLLGFTAATGMTEKPSRAFRSSVLDLVAAEYARTAPGLGREAKQKLLAHGALVRDLQQNLASNANASCNKAIDQSRHEIRQFMQLMRVALACDLTRVITYVAPPVVHVAVAIDWGQRRVVRIDRRPRQRWNAPVMAWPTTRTS